ncbi:MAG TPA: DUF934 domain-containing protein [Steroidobacteraceae bacterium]|nr:DUF934 domain-containing protein [Steroidobacteraceae bacterium]
MPRRLLRDAAIVIDEWRTLAELEADGPRPDPLQPGSLQALRVASTPLILSFAQWRAERERWQALAGPLGVILAPADPVEALIEDLPRFALLGAEFPGPGDGRGYTQGRLLRERWHFPGELRACGYVRQDQLFLLARCGFNSFELPESELEAARLALDTFSAAYQPANDAGLRRSLRRRA